MATTDATPHPKKNVAFRAYFGIFKSDGTLITGATGLDSEVIKDGGTPTDAGDEAHEIGTSGVYYIDLTNTEMNADSVVLLVKSTSTGAVPVVLPMYPQETGDIKVDLTSINGSGAVATNLEKSASTIVRGTVAAGSTTSSINTSDLTEATNDHYKDRWLIFVTGVAAGQGKQITGYNGTTKTLATGAFQDAPATSDTFVIV
jgi:hypothetical protein